MIPLHTLRTVFPLDTAFNVAVNHMASRVLPTGFDTTDNKDEAPASLEDLNAHVAKTGRIIVWTGNSDKTIYACPDTNWAARAWHDWGHWYLQADFTAAGEAKVAELQKMQLGLVYGRTSARIKYWQDLIDIEVNDQVAYFERYGEFPEDQMRFATNAMQARAYAKGWGAVA